MRAFWISVARAESMPCWPCDFLWCDDFEVLWDFEDDLVVWEECAEVEVFLCVVVVVVVVANAGAAVTAADSRNARLARDKSIAGYLKKLVSWTFGTNSTGASIECANKKEPAPEKCGG
jgi:hypothetical protein